jgi:hypothetical protein
MNHLNSIWMWEALPCAWSHNCSCWSLWLLGVCHLQHGSDRWGPIESTMHSTFLFSIFLVCCMLGEAKVPSQCWLRMLCGSTKFLESIVFFDSFLEGRSSTGSRMLWSHSHFYFFDKWINNLLIYCKKTKPQCFQSMCCALQWQEKCEMVVKSSWCQ